MHTVSAIRTIDTPVATVWNTLDDFGNVYRFHPKVEHSKSISHITNGEGARRQSDYYDGSVIREEVVKSVDRQRQVIDTYDTGPGPLRKNVTRIDLKPIDEHSTEVTLTMSFVPKYGPAGWLRATLMMKSQLRDLSEDILAGLDTHLQTGAIVGRNGNLETADAPSAMAA